MIYQLWFTFLNSPLCFLSMTYFCCEYDGDSASWLITVVLLNPPCFWNCCCCSLLAARVSDALNKSSLLLRLRCDLPLILPPSLPFLDHPLLEDNCLGDLDVGPSLPWTAPVPPPNHSGDRRIISWVKIHHELLPFQLTEYRNYYWLNLSSNYNLPINN